LSAEQSTAAPIPPRTAATGTFAKRVAGVLATRVTLFAIAFATSILLSRILGPAGKGEYVAVVTLPGMLAALGMLGLPSAVNYYAGKGASLRSLIKAAAIFTVVLSAIMIVVVWVSLPVLEASILRAAPDNLLRVVLLTIPAGMIVSFGGAILYGRHAVKVYNLIQLWLAAVLLGLVVVLVMLMKFGINGAVAGSVTYNLLTATAVMVAVRRLSKTSPGDEPASLRQISSYGIRAAPSLFASYFNYRADTYVIQAEMSNYRYALGQYSMAVTMDELIFYIPDSISTILLPRVAGATPEEANQWIGRVGRLTTLLSVGMALCLIPTAFVGIHVILPRFGDSLPPFLVLLPGAISMSLAKVMGSFVAGRGRPGLMAAGTIGVLVINIALNIVLIPRLGIVGASLSSLVSYTCQAGLYVHLASRLSGQPRRSLFVPGLDEVRIVFGTATRLRRRVLKMTRLARFR
jgi:O-antigen/teichoic acid export membrane protein